METTTSSGPATTFSVRRASPATDCRDGLTSIEPSYVVAATGRYAGFSLRVVPRTVSVGGRIAVSLINVSDATRTTGNRMLYDVQRRDGAVWRTIFGMRDGGYYLLEGIRHEPGEGLHWDLTVSQAGLSGAIDTRPTYHVCSPIEPGEYRFVYWGISERNRDDDTDRGVGVPFRVVG